MSGHFLLFSKKETAFTFSPRSKQKRKQKGKEDLHIGLPGLQGGAEGGSALLGGNILNKGNDVGQGLDGGQIDTDNQTLDGHHLGGDLKPSSGGCAQIDKDLGPLEEIVFFVQLDQLEGRTGTITLFLGHVVVLIQTSYISRNKIGCICQPLMPFAFLSIDHMFNARPDDSWLPRRRKEMAVG